MTQTSYVEQPACPKCANGQTTGTPDVAQPRTFEPPATDTDASRPSVPPETSPTPREGQKLETNDTEQPQPGPVDETNETPAEDPYKVDNTESSTMFEAPKLHDPNDRTAQRHIAPVKTALYKQPVAYRNVSTQRVTAEQARKDAIGWTSVSK